MAIIMKIFIVLIVLIALTFGLCESFDFERKELESEESLWKMYKRWSSHHRISRSGKETLNRFKVFKENAKYVFKVTQMNKPFKLKLNQFADMSNDEFMRIYTSSNITHYKNLHANAKKTNRIGGFMYEDASDLPSSIDWRKKGAVNDIKNQGNNCGSCWAFAAVGAVESINQIKTNELVSLSEQELMDCDNRDGGCGGGFYNSAFDFIMENDGITTEDNYPYYAEDGYCRTPRRNKPRVTIDGYENVPSNDENALKKAVAHQPVAVAIAAGGQDFQFYWEGMFRENYNCGDFINHTVVVVGYGTDEDGTDYWIIRNSWGHGWGSDGYMKLQRGVSQPEGLCGLAMSPSYPVKY